MTRYYTTEKARFGGTTGTIIPFTTQLPFFNIPTELEWPIYLPAGYLRCDGSILRADLYPGLSDILGVGNLCTFAKDPDNLSSDFFQLPDLGSKYIKASTSSGEYFDNLVTTSESELERVGAQVAVSTLVGDEVSITYGGAFNIVPGEEDFFGNPLYESNDNNGFTREAFLSEDNFQAHGHKSDVGVFTYTGRWTDSAWNDLGGRGDNEGAMEGANELLPVEPPALSSPAPAHTHQVNLPGSTELRDNTNYKFSYNPDPVDPVGLRTDITLTASSVQKLDKAISPYILMEYIIKY